MPSINALAVPLLLSALACSGPARSPLTLDCTEGAGDLALETYEAGSATESLPGWYAYPDNAPGSTDSMQVQAIEGGRCASAQALVLSATGHSYAGWGTYQIGGATVQDGSKYAGISFWARIPGATDKGFVFSLNDVTSAKDAPGCVNLTATRILTCQAIAGSQARHCTAQDDAAADCTLNVATQQLDCTSGGAKVVCSDLAQANEVSCELPATCKVNSVNGSLNCTQGLLEPPANACGNPFSTTVLTTADWRYYRLPWSAFQQGPDARRQPHGIDPSQLYGWLVDAPTWAHFELWLDDVSFYAAP